MLLIYDMLIVIGLVGALGFAVRRWSDRRFYQKDALHYHFRNCRRNARAKRLDWLRENSSLSNPFLDPEYEELWQFEIGAEAHLRVYLPNTVEISWREYKNEQEKYHIEDV